MGIGHWPLIPITGRVYRPSGFAETHVMLKSYIRVSATATEAQNIDPRKKDSEGAMLEAQVSGSSMRRREYRRELRRRHIPKRLSLEKRAFTQGLFSSILAPVLQGLDAEMQGSSALVADSSRDHQSVPDNPCHTTSDQHSLPDW